MDLLGEIVERDPVDPYLATSSNASSSNTFGKDDSVKLTGFPKLINKKEMSSWKVRLQQKKKKQQQHLREQLNQGQSSKDKSTQKEQEEEGGEGEEEGEEGEDDGEGEVDQSKLTESEKIHLENIKYMMSMSEEQILKEKEELMNNLDPQVLKSLLTRIHKKDSAASTTSSNSTTATSGGKDMPLYAEIDTNKYWVGGSSKNKNMEKLDDSEIIKQLNINDKEDREVDIQEEVEEEVQEVEEERFDDEALAPQEYQFIQQMDHMTNEELLNDVHFIKPHKHRHKHGTGEVNAEEGEEEEYTPLSIDDPEFDSKLREKYFPDLPVEINKLQWMSNDQGSNDDSAKVETIENVAEIRFDFKGNMVALNKESKTTKDGLHHHSEKQHLKGYNLEELSTYARSTFPSQKCIALQTLGRILYKLGKQSYYELVPEIDVEQFEQLGGTVESITNVIYKMFWDWIKHLNIVEIIEMNLNSNNLSIKNYATDAMWLYKQGGGFKETKEALESKIQE